MGQQEDTFGPVRIHPIQRQGTLQRPTGVVAGTGLGQAWERIGMEQAGKMEDGNSFAGGMAGEVDRSSLAR